MAIGNLEALFSNVGGVIPTKADLMNFGVIGAGVIAAPILYNMAFDKLLEVTKQDPAGVLNKWGRPVIGLVAGIALGNKLRRMGHYNVGMGVSVGLTATALAGLVINASPSFATTLHLIAAAPAVTATAPVAGLFGAPTEVEEVSGAPISVEAVGGMNFAAALS